MPAEPLPAPVDGEADTPGWESVVGAIGPKVRALRLSRGLTLQQLAQAADVSTASVHKVERGDMVPTVTTLLKIAGALGAPVRHFVEDDDTVRAGVHTRFTGRLDTGPVTITGPADRFRARGTALRLAPGAESTGRQRSGETLLVVLEGTLQVELAADRYTVAAGEALHFSSEVEHRIHNDGAEPADAVLVDVPED